MFKAAGPDKDEAWCVHGAGLIAVFGEPFMRYLTLYMPNVTDKVGMWVPLDKYQAAASHEYRVEYQGEWVG